VICATPDAHQWEPGEFALGKRLPAGGAFVLVPLKVCAKCGLLRMAEREATPPPECRPLFDRLYRWHPKPGEFPRAFECRMGPAGYECRALLGNTVALETHMIEVHGVSETLARECWCGSTD